MTKKNKEIQKPHLILCEGEDATQFIITLLNYFIKKDSRFDNYQALDFGGIKDLGHFLGNIVKVDNFDIVKSLIVIRDAEQNAKSAADSVKNSFTTNGLPCSDAMNAVSDNGFLKTGFTLFPSCGMKLENGTLENLCLRMLSKENASDVLTKADLAIEHFCFKRPHKNRLHMYFSLTDEYVGCKLGEAAKFNAFDFNCPEISSLSDFLSQIF